MLIEALLIITLIWKQPKYPSTGEWINKWMHLYNRILLSNKRNELLIHSMVGSQNIRQKEARHKRV